LKLPVTTACLSKNHLFVGLLPRIRNDLDFHAAAMGILQHTGNLGL